MLTPERALIFGLGDGVYAAGGAAVTLDVGPDNAPPYLAYRLLDPQLLALAPGALTPAVHHDGPTEALEALLIATDGLADLDGGAVTLVTW